MGRNNVCLIHTIFPVSGRMYGMKQTLDTCLFIHLYLLSVHFHHAFLCMLDVLVWIVYVLFLLLFFSFIFINWRLITTFQWVLSYIDMNQPWNYMYSPSRSPLPPPSPPDSSGSSQCTRPEHLSHASHLG